MGWAAIITAILQLIGPYIMEWLKTLIDRWLNKTANSMGFTAESNTDVKTSTGLLLDKAITALPRFAWGRRMLFMNIRRIVNHRLATSNNTSDPFGLSVPLSVYEQQELRESVGCAERELEPLDI